MGVTALPQEVLTLTWPSLALLPAFQPLRIFFHLPSCPYICHIPIPGEVSLPQVLVCVCMMLCVCVCDVCVEGVGHVFMHDVWHMVFVFCDVCVVCCDVYMVCICGMLGVWYVYVCDMWCGTGLICYVLYVWVVGYVVRCVVCVFCVRCSVCFMVWGVHVCCVCGTCEVGTGHLFLCSKEGHVQVEVQQRLRKFLNSRLQIPLCGGQAMQRTLGAGTAPGQTDAQVVWGGRLQAPAPLSLEPGPTG